MSTRNDEIRLLLLDMLCGGRGADCEIMTGLGPQEWAALAAMARQHRLEPLLHRIWILHPHWAVPEDIIRRWRRSFRRDALRALACEKVLAQVAARLDAAERPIRAERGVARTPRLPASGAQAVARYRYPGAPGASDRCIRSSQGRGLRSAQLLGAVDEYALVNGSTCLGWSRRQAGSASRFTIASSHPANIATRWRSETDAVLMPVRANKPGRHRLSCRPTRFSISSSTPSMSMNSGRPAGHH